MATSSAPPRSAASTRLNVVEDERLIGAGEQDDLRLVVEADQIDALEVLRLRVAEVEDPGARTLLAQPGARRDRRRQDVGVGEREARLAERRAEARPAERGGVGDHAQGHAGGVQARHGRRRSGQRPPRHGEHAVHVEQQAVDVREGHTGRPSSRRWCRSRDSNPDAARGDRGL